MTLTTLRRALRAAARPGDAEHLARFFKTGPGQYSAGDRFLGVRVPAVRSLVKTSDALPADAIPELLESPWHEDRLLGLLIWVRRFERGTETERKQIVTRYLAATHAVNNWDLVDQSAPYLLGVWLRDRPRSVLRRLVRSQDLWERRIAIVSTLGLIRHGDLTDTLALSEQLLGDREDLLHKATGWMLREAGKRDGRALESFLDRHAPRMPRTMLRYAIERFPEKRRRHYLAAK